MALLSRRDDGCSSAARLAKNRSRSRQEQEQEGGMAHVRVASVTETESVTEVTDMEVEVVDGQASGTPLEQTGADTRPEEAPAPAPAAGQRRPPSASGPRPPSPPRARVAPAPAPARRAPPGLLSARAAAGSDVISALLREGHRSRQGECLPVAALGSFEEAIWIADSAWNLGNLLLLPDKCSSDRHPHPHTQTHPLPLPIPQPWMSTTAPPTPVQQMRRPPPPQGRQGRPAITPAETASHAAVYAWRRNAWRSPSTTMKPAQTWVRAVK